MRKFIAISYAIRRRHPLLSKLELRWNVLYVLGDDTFKMLFE